MYQHVIVNLKPLLQEGKVYYIDSFTVRYANRTYRPVAHSQMILFTKWTTLEECVDVPADFPAITFSLTPFGDVPSLVDKNIFYVGNNLSIPSYYIYTSFASLQHLLNLYHIQTDIMGVIAEIGTTSTVRPQSRNTDSLKRTLQICDARLVP